MKLSLRWKWMVAHLAISTLVLLFMVIYLSSRLETYFESSFERRWQRELNLAHDYAMAIDYHSLTAAERDAWTDRIGTILGMRVTLIDTSGTVLGDSQVDLAKLRELENHRDRPEVRDAVAAGFGRSRRQSSTVDLDLFYLAKPLGNSPNWSGVIRVAISGHEIDEALLQINQLIWLGISIGFVLVIVIGLIASKSITGRMNEIVQTANRMAKGDFSKRIPLGSGDEFSILAAALNQMSADLRQHVKQITQERNQLQTILNSMVEGVMVANLDHRLVLTNRSFDRIFNHKTSVEGKSIGELLQDPRFLTAVDEAIKNRRDASIPLELQSPARKYLEAYIGLLGETGQPWGVVAVFHDITQLQHLEQVRRDFVANISHELRTPLTAIKGYIETLLDDSSLDKDAATQFMRTVLKHSNRMSKLVEDLLNLAKLESTPVEDNLEEIDLRESIRRVADNFSNLQAKLGVKLVLELPDQYAPVKCLVPEVETALENLIDNALKYGADGKFVTVGLVVHANEVEVFVSDHGIGIPVEDQPRIFERFYRVDKARSHALGGTGLGLSIVKHSIQRHNGRVWLESSAGEGATFHFALPRALT